MNADIKLLLLRCAKDVLLTGEWHSDMLLFSAANEGYTEKDILGLVCKTTLGMMNEKRVLSMNFPEWKVLIGFDNIRFNLMIGSKSSFAHNFSLLLSIFSDAMIGNTSVFVGDNQAAFERDLCLLMLRDGAG